MFRARPPIPGTPNNIDIHTAFDDAIDAIDALLAAIKTYYPNQVRNGLTLALTITVGKAPHQPTHKDIIPLFATLTAALKTYNHVKLYLLHPTSSVVIQYKKDIDNKLQLLNAELDKLITESNKELTDIWSHLHAKQKAIQAMISVIQTELTAQAAVALPVPAVSGYKETLDSHTIIQHLEAALNAAALNKSPDSKSIFADTKEYDAVNSQFTVFRDFCAKFKPGQANLPDREIAMQLYYAAYTFQSGVASLADTKSVLHAGKIAIFTLEYANTILNTVKAFLTNYPSIAGEFNAVNSIGYKSK